MLFYISKRRWYTVRLFLGIFFIFLFLLPLFLFSADACVVIECFARVGWPYCPTAEANIVSIYNQYGPEDVAPIIYHVSDGYSTVPGNERANYYGISGVPDVFCDGYDLPNYSYNQINSRVITRLSVDRDMTIDLNWDFTPTMGGYIDITATVSLVNDLSSGNWRLYIYIIEDDVSNSYDFVLRDMEYYSLSISSNGEQQVETSTFQVKGNYDDEMISIGAFVEDYNGGAQYNIHQGVMDEHVLDTAIQSTSLGAIKTLFEWDGILRR